MQERAQKMQIGKEFYVNKDSVRSGVEVEYRKTKLAIHILSGIFYEFRYSKVIQMQIFIFRNILKSDIPLLISAVKFTGADPEVLERGTQ